MKRLHSQGSRFAGAKPQRFLRDPAPKLVPESESDEESESSSIVVSLDAPALPVKRLASQGSRAAGVRVDSVRLPTRAPGLSVELTAPQTAAVRAPSQGSRAAGSGRP